MLKCEEVAARSSALIDGELGAWEALQIRIHLAMCKGCSRFIDQMRTTQDLTRTAAPEPDDTAAQRGIEAVLSRLHDETQRGD